MRKKKAKYDKEDTMFLLPTRRKTIRNPPKKDQQKIVQINHSPNRNYTEMYRLSLMLKHFALSGPGVMTLEPWRRNVIMATT